jgi:hypothetical protein
MPSTSKKQSRFMQAVAHSPSFAKKVGVSKSVGKDFSTADKGRKFADGGGVDWSKRAAAAREDVRRSQSDEPTPEEHAEMERVKKEAKRGSQEDKAPTTRTTMPTFAKGGFLKAKINKQNTKHGKMDMPFTNLNRFAGMKKGGNVKRYYEGGDEGIEGREGRTDEQVNQTLNKAIKDSTTFGDAFKSARSDGEKTFMWRGKSYSTELAKPKATQATVRKAEPPSAQPARFKRPADFKANVDIAKGIEQKAFGMKKGGNVKESKSMMNKEVAFFKKKGAPTSMVKHEQKEAKEMKFAKGGGIESRGKTKGTIIKMASGGAVKGFARGGGIESRGKTRGKMC